MDSLLADRWRRKTTCAQSFYAGGVCFFEDVQVVMTPMSPRYSRFLKMVTQYCAIHVADMVTPMSERFKEERRLLGVSSDLIRHAARFPGGEGTTCSTSFTFHKLHVFLSLSLECSAGVIPHRT